MRAMKLKQWIRKIANFWHTPDDEPCPTPGEIAAVRQLIPAGNRQPAELQLVTMFRLGWWKRDSKPQPIYTLEPLTPASPIVHVDHVGLRQMYHPSQAEKVDMPPGDYFKARHKEFLPDAPTVAETPAMKKPAWLNELVQQQEMTEQEKQEDEWLVDDDITTKRPIPKKAG
jgi:hypothetical protein